MQRFLCVLVVGAASIIAATKAGGDEPSSVVRDHYRLIPRLSVLHQTGGFGGFDWRYRLLGDFDLVHGEGWTARAKFDDAEIWGSIISDEPTPAVVLDVDALLDLENLEGHRLPVAAPFDVFGFRGKIPDGSSINLYAAAMGSWLYMRGLTEPPPGSADYFVYQLRAVARKRPLADFDNDGVVDGRDLVAWRAGSAEGDADGDGVVDGADLLAWQRQAGETPPDLDALDSMLTAALAAAGSPSLAAVPEPVAGAMLAVILGASCRIRSRGRRAGASGA